MEPDRTLHICNIYVTETIPSPQILIYYSPHKVLLYSHLIAIRRQAQALNTLKAQESPDLGFQTGPSPSQRHMLHLEGGGHPCRPDQRLPAAQKY